LKTATLPPCASRWQLKLQTTPLLPILLAASRNISAREFLRISIKANHLESRVSPEVPVVAGDVMHSACDPELSDAGNVWGGDVDRYGEWWESAVLIVLSSPLLSVG
jgi:hypothetical protein